MSRESTNSNIDVCLVCLDEEEEEARCDAVNEVGRRLKSTDMNHQDMNIGTPNAITRKEVKSTCGANNLAPNVITRKGVKSTCGAKKNVKTFISTEALDAMASKKAASTYGAKSGDSTYLKGEGTLRPTELKALVHKEAQLHTYTQNIKIEKCQKITKGIEPASKYGQGRGVITRPRSSV